MTSAGASQVADGTAAALPIKILFLAFAFSPSNMTADPVWMQMLKPLLQFPGDSSRASRARAGSAAAQQTSVGRMSRRKEGSGQRPP